MTCVIAAVIGYAIGSVPYAYLIAKRRQGLDIRTVGSGNVGAANVRRTVGGRAALLTVALDAAKGAASVFAVRAAGGGVLECAVAGVAAVAGHVYPVWLRMRGGKGVSTTFGACLVWIPPVAGAAFVVFVVTVWASRFVSLGSVLAAAVIGPLAFAWGAPRPTGLALCAAGALIVFRHRGNLRRIRAGTERRLG